MHTNTAMTGHELRAIRRNLGMTQGEFAVQLGIALNSLSRLETGRCQITELRAMQVRMLTQETTMKAPRYRLTGTQESREFSSLRDARKALRQARAGAPEDRVINIQRWETTTAVDGIPDGYWETI